MSNAVASILRRATRQKDEKLNIITFPTHEAFETGLATTGHNFWSFRHDDVKDWNHAYRPVPDNYVLLNKKRGKNQLPPEVDYDVVLSQNKFGQFGLARDIARRLHLPLVSLEHTLPMASWGKSRLAALKAMRGDVNVFISEFSRREWGWAEDEAVVVHHGIDTDTFSPAPLLVDRRPQVLSVVNDWANRDWCCGFNLWRQASADLPTVVVGDTPGLSKPARSTAELVLRYRESRIFLNTSLVSPVPTALLEAMSCGCAVVSTATCMIPEIIVDGVNGFLCDTPRAINDRCRLLLADESLAARVGNAARETIMKDFTLKRFASEWDAVFRRAADTVYKG